jgi:hypothetical protein
MDLGESILIEISTDNSNLCKLSVHKYVCIHIFMYVDMCEYKLLCLFT